MPITVQTLQVGGICSYFSNAVIENCTIANNDAVGMYGFGGGINVMYGMLLIDNCVLWGNTGQSGDQMKNMDKFSYFFPTVMFRIPAAALIGIPRSAQMAESNIDSDPNFVDTDNG